MCPGNIHPSIVHIHVHMQPCTLHMQPQPEAGLAVMLAEEGNTSGWSFKPSCPLHCMQAFASLSVMVDRRRNSCMLHKKDSS